MPLVRTVVRAPLRTAVNKQNHVEAIELLEQRLEFEFTSGAQQLFHQMSRCGEPDRRPVIGDTHQLVL